MEQIQELLARFFKEVVIAGVGLVIIGLGVWWLVKDSDIAVKQESLGGNEVLPNDSQKKDVVVDVGGGVAKPGVYVLSAGDRFQDAIDAAGGLSDQADLQVIEKSINLAEKLKDGQKIYLPMVGKTSLEYNKNLISINNATQSELEALNGVGSSTADKIIAGRPYFSLEDLVEREIMGQKLFEKVRSQISL